LPLISLKNQSTINSKKPRNSLLSLSKKPSFYNRKHLTQNSQTESLHERALFRENSEDFLKDLISVKKFNKEAFRMKFAKLKPFSNEEKLNFEEKNSASTQTTALVSREGPKESLSKENSSAKNHFLIKKQVFNKENQLKIFFLEHQTNFFEKFIKIRKKAPFVKKIQIKPEIPKKNSLCIENIQQNESIFLEDSVKIKEDAFSDLHLIKEVSSQASSIDKNHEVLICEFFFGYIDFQKRRF